MCGIAGILTADAELARRAIRAMNAAQEHRGPDDGGETVLQVGDRWLGLGVRRLAVIDPSPAGHQPMQNPTSGSWIAYNGEIYALNAKPLRRDLAQEGVHFRGHSDTEVLLHVLDRWGSDWLRRLDGMFAFAYYRAANRTLMLARDVAGIKPLYIARRGGHLIFASEVRAILATGLVPPRVDPAGLASFLAYGAVQEPGTLTEGVCSLEPGTAITIDLVGDAPDCVERFWEYPPIRPASLPELVEEIRMTLANEVRSHLVSDVPLGIFLSAGLDSTILAGLAAASGARLCTYTVSVEGDDEEPVARRTAELIGAEHRAIVVHGQDAAEWSKLWLSRLDQPSIDGLNTFIVSRAAWQAGVVVALCGHGGDELFGGYPSFRDVPGLQRRVALVSKLPSLVRHIAARAAAAGRNSVVRDKALDLVDSDGAITTVYFHRRRLHSNRQMRELGVGHPPEGLTRNFIRPEAIPPCLPDDVMASVARLEFATYLRSTLLRDSDAASMASSIELRVPMLSRPMLDLMLSIPGSLLLPKGVPGKYLQRLAFADLLRPEVLDRPKSGFSLPIGRWMLGPLREPCRVAIEALRASDLLAPRGIDGVWTAFEREPESPAWSRAWALVVLGSFLHHATV